MKEVSKINNVKEFFIKLDKLWIFDGKILIEEPSKIVKEVKDFFGKIYKHNNDIIVIQYYTGEFILVIDDKEEKIKGYYNSNIKDIADIYFQNLETNKIQIVTAEGKILDTNFQSNGYLNNGYYIQFDSVNNVVNRRIKILSNENREVLFDLANLDTSHDVPNEKPLQVSQFSGVYQDTLVSTLNNGGILLLNIKNGELLRYFPEAHLRSDLYQKSAGSPVFLGLHHQTFIELDAEQQRITRQVDLENTFRNLLKTPPETPVPFFIRAAVFHEGLFYFIAHKNTVGIFDPQTETIVDHFVFTFENASTTLPSGPENLQIANGNIYVLDTSGTLHVLKI